MKTFFILTFITLFTICSQAQDTIKYTSFEGDSLAWKGRGLGAGLISDTLSSLKGDTTQGFNDFPKKQRILTGKRSWQINSTKDTIIMDSVIVAVYDSVRFRLRFSGTSTNLGQGLDNEDSIKIYVAVNGNSFPALPQIRIAGSNKTQGEGQTQWGFSADSIIKTSYDTSTVYAVPGEGKDTLTSSSTAIITFFKPGVTSIKVKIIVFNNQNAEFFNIDDLILLGRKSKALAIKGMSFNVREQDNGVILHWSKVDESTCLKYNVERSVDFKSFDNIKSMDCQIKVNILHSYSYHDLGASPGWNYYRIKLNFLDGSFDYSEIKSIYRNNTAAFKVYPTLVHDVLQVSAPGISDYKYVIVDMNGKTFQVKKNSIDTKSILVDQLPSGVYFILLTSGGTSETFKFIRF
ncbi:MAG: T9SS type A sorting domain-containing protein [Saprospiraceae bacterium]